MFKLANSFDEFQIVCKRSEPGSDLRKVTLQILFEKAGAKGQYEAVLKLSERNSEIYRLTSQILAGMCDPVAHYSK